MAFARINGIELPATQGSVRQTRTALQRSTETWSGVPRRDEAGIVRSWTMELCLLTDDQADALEGLIEGRAHHFGFDEDAFSDDGLGPDTAAAGNYTIESDGNEIFGVGYIDIVNPVVWATRIRLDYTIMYWRNLTTTAEHIVVTSDGRKFLDGVRSDLTPTPELVVTASNGAMSLDTGQYDDLVVLPFLVPDDYVIFMYDWMAGESNPFSSLPKLVLDGDIVGGDEVVVLGQTDGQSYLQVTRETVFETNARNFEIRLDEVEQYIPVKFPEPYEAFLFDQGYENTLTNQLMPAAGVCPGEVVGAWTKGLTGPFGLGESWNSGGTAFLRLPTCWAENLKGIPQMTVFAWVRRATLGAAQIVFHAEVVSPYAADSRKMALLLDFPALNVVGLQARPAVSESAVTLGAGSVTDTTNFSLIGAAVDIPNDSMTFYLNGAVISTQVASFTVTQFSDETGDDAHVCIDADEVGFPFDGDIAGLYFFDRIMTEQEATNIYELGKRGILI